jgi:hypothetical protein
MDFVNLHRAGADRTVQFAHDLRLRPREVSRGERGRRPGALDGDLD